MLQWWPEFCSTIATESASCKSISWNNCNIRKTATQFTIKLQFCESWGDVCQRFDVLHIKQHRILKYSETEWVKAQIT